MVMLAFFYLKHDAHLREKSFSTRLLKVPLRIEAQGPPAWALDVAQDVLEGVYGDFA